MSSDFFAVSRLNFNLRLRTFSAFIAIGLCFQINNAKAESTTSLVEQNPGMIEVYYAPVSTEPYLERRGDWALIFSLNRESLKPEKYMSISAAQINQSFATMFGESSEIRMLQGSLGVKYNFSLGAITLEGQYGSGEISDGRSGTNRTLSLTKKAIVVGWILDAIYSEPYVAPYVQGQILDFTYLDKDADGVDIKGTTAPTTGLTAGLLIQLNSIDPTDVALKANHDHGLNNTYLDIFVTQYNTSNAANDPQLQTAFNWGVGLKLEF